jgi:nucleoid-associated protein YgaU
MAAMTLEKLKILVETGPGQFGKELTALFNPEQISISKSANWRLAPASERDVPTSQFTHGEPATLSLDLLFDTYESGKDVLSYTGEIFKLTTVQAHGNLHRPPLCRLRWGTFTLDDFQWVLTSLTQRFSLFLANGTPVRANLTCSFQQWRSDEEEAKLLNKQSADVAKTHTVRRGDTLSAIAAEQYEDSTLWRPIAEANRLTNPRRLTPGQVLVIPALRERGAAQR